MSTGITSHCGALIATFVVLTGAAILRNGAALADPNQDQQFLALLDKEEIPAVEGVPNLIATAHKVCRKLDGGMPADTLVGAMTDNAYKNDPIERAYPRGRVMRTMSRFITASVGAYCPYDERNIASIMARPTSGSTEPTFRVAAYTRDVAGPGIALRTSAPEAHGAMLASLIGTLPSGGIADPNPPLPTPPPAAQIQTPHRAIAAQPPPKRTPPPPQQPPPPPAVGLQPGGASGGAGGGAGGGGGDAGGGNGGGGPAEPSPAQDMSPGYVRLAP